MPRFAGRRVPAAVPDIQVARPKMLGFCHLSKILSLLECSAGRVVSVTEVAEHKARTKADRARIAKILDRVVSVTKIDVDIVTDQRTSQAIPLSLLRGFVEIDGRDCVLYQVTPDEFVYLGAGGRGRYVTKYVLRTNSPELVDL
jgi:hypothetical protein